MVKYKMMVNWKEYDGAYTVDECGENVKVALNSMPELYNPSFTFTKVNDDGSPYVVKSTKKSKSQPKSFNDMVKKQRKANNGLVKAEDEDNQWLWNKQDLYSVMIPKIESASSELVRRMQRVRNYETYDDIDTDTDQLIYESIFTIEELLNTLKDDIDNYE